MRIVFLLTQDLSSPSGLGRYLPWAKELHRTGYDVRILALHPDYSQLQEKRVSVDGVEVEYIAQMHVRKEGNSKTYFSPTQLIWITLKATIILTIKSFSNRPDIVVIGKPHPMNGVAAMFLKFIKPSVKIIVDCDDIETASNRIQNNFQKSVVAWFEKQIPKAGHVVTTNTYYNLDRLRRMGVASERLIYLPNGVDMDRFSPPAEEQVELLRDQLGLTGKRVVSFIGSMSLSNHPVDLLLRAFKFVHKEDPYTILLLVGGGEDMDVLRNLVTELEIEECTVFVGRVPPERISLYYALSDVTVDPVYDNEAARGRCPLKMFESWACGVPFVTGDVGDRDRLMDGPLSGLLAIPGDSEDFARVIFEALDNQAYRQKTANIYRKRASGYCWSNLRPIILRALAA